MESVIKSILLTGRPKSKLYSPLAMAAVCAVAGCEACRHCAVKGAGLLVVAESLSDSAKLRCRVAEQLAHNKVTVTKKPATAKE